MNRLSLMGALVAALLLAGCQRNDNGMGPAQQAGKAVDEAGAKVTTKVQEQVRKADVAAQQAREHVKEATADASRKLDQATVEVGKKVEQAGEKLQQAAH